MTFLENYKFTNKNHPWKGIMSSVLGGIAVVSMVIALYLSYRDGGTTKMQYAAATALAFVMAMVGEILGLISNAEKDRYRFFPILGLVLNSLSLFGGVYILYMGI